MNGAEDKGVSPEAIILALPPQSRRQSINKAFMMYNDVGEFDLNAPAAAPVLDPVLTAPLADVSDVYVVLHDFAATCGEELSVTRGARVKVLDRAEDPWWKVTLLPTGATGFVPSSFTELSHRLHDEEWFAGPISQSAAELTLMSWPDFAPGCFLVRESEWRPNQFLLAVAAYTHVHHLHILREETDYRLDGASQRFLTVSDLVRFYAQPSNLVRQLPAPLLQPCAAPWFPAIPDPAASKTWEVPRSAVVKVGQLGAGEFGEVWQGSLEGKPVALKTMLAGTMHDREFLNEAEIMKPLSHPFIVQLLAVCTVGSPLFIVAELVARGSLLTILEKCERRMTLRAMLRHGVQIALGMSYLAFKHTIHRDLAARNILVAEDNSVKVGDFGFALRATPETGECIVPDDAKFPIKWTAPEAALLSRFSSKSDVWSFGILLTELVTFGRAPYPGLTNDEALQKVELGLRMPAPPGCPAALYQLMLDCWSFNPDERPTFDELATRLTALAVAPSLPLATASPLVFNSTTATATATATTATTAITSPAQPVVSGGVVTVIPPLSSATVVGGDS